MRKVEGEVFPYNPTPRLKADLPADLLLHIFPLFFLQQIRLKPPYKLASCWQAPTDSCSPPPPSYGPLYSPISIWRSWCSFCSRFVWNHLGSCCQAPAAPTFAAFETILSAADLSETTLAAPTNSWLQQHSRLSVKTDQSLSRNCLLVTLKISPVGSVAFPCFPLMLIKCIIDSFINIKSN